MVEVNKLLNLLTVIPFEQMVPEEFGKILRELKQIGRPTGEMEALCFVATVKECLSNPLNSTQHEANGATLKKTLCA